MAVVGISREEPHCLALMQEHATTCNHGRNDRVESEV
jgi:hypothetical protein